MSDNSNTKIEKVKRKVRFDVEIEDIKDVIIIKDVQTSEVIMDESKMVPISHNEKHIKYGFHHLLCSLLPSIIKNGIEYNFINYPIQFKLRNILFTYTDGIFYLPKPCKIHEQFILDICDDIGFEFNRLDELLYGETCLVGSGDGMGDVKLLLHGYMERENVQKYILNLIDYRVSGGFNSDSDC